MLIGKEVSYDDQEGFEKNGNYLQVQKFLLINALPWPWFQQHGSSGILSRALLFFTSTRAVQRPLSFLSVITTGA
jgi:hypothetical protein